MIGCTSTETSRRSRYSSGSASVKVEPRPGVERTVMLPPSSVASLRHSGSPRPLPSLRRSCASTCVNSSKMRSLGARAVDAGVEDVGEELQELLRLRAQLRLADAALVGAARRLFAHPVAQELVLVGSNELGDA